jgi:dipeptidyl aminopeptidase/acylaminoacyl peptidase
MNLKNRTKKIAFLCAITCLWLFNPLQKSVAQTLGGETSKKKFTLEEIVTNHLLYPEAVYDVQARPETNFISYLDYEKGLLQIDNKGNTEVLLTFEDLSQNLVATGRNPLLSYPQFVWAGKNEIRFENDNLYLSYQIDTKRIETLTQIDGAAANKDYAKSGAVAYTKNYNLFIAQNGNQIAVTQDGSLEVSYGEAAHRNEFGITKGTFWSPDGAKLAFSRIDQSGVTSYPLADYAPATATHVPIKYPMAGATSQRVTIGVFDVKSQKTVYLQTGEPSEQYLTNLTWSPDGKQIYLAVVNRAQDEAAWRVYDAQSGKFLKELFKEQDPQWVEPQHPLVFLPQNPNQFLVQSERNGFNHLYLYDTNGKFIRAVTQGEGQVLKFLGFDAKGERVFYVANFGKPLENHLFVSEIATGKTTQLSTQGGVHGGTLNGDGSLLLDTYSSPDVPFEALLLDTKTGKTIATVKKSKNPLEKYEIGEISIQTHQAADGQTLYSRLIKPTNFDPSRKYPVMVYVYGGPHVQLINQSFRNGADYFMLYMAQQGYVVFTLDNRGSANRGANFEQVVHRKLGENEVADQMVGINYLKSLPFVDTEKMGVFGWSFGGFMATSLMLKHPDVFKVGVAGGAVVDWKYYEVMYTERYMDTPQENPEGYLNASLLNKIHQLKGKLLLIHGLQDDVVVPQHTFALVEKAIKEGVLLDYFPYPSHPHNVRGKDRIHLYRKVASYLDEVLKK